MVQLAVGHRALLRKQKDVPLTELVDHGTQVQLMKHTFKLIGLLNQEAFAGEPWREGVKSYMKHLRQSSGVLLELLKSEYSEAPRINHLYAEMLVDNCMGTARFQSDQTVPQWFELELQQEKEPSTI